MENTKLCIYAITKNEIDHLEEWYDRVKTADYIYVLDTGSTDGTIEKLEELGIPHSSRSYLYFNFATARNSALAIARQHANSEDWIFMHLDLDEYLEYGGIEKIKEQWDGTCDQMSLYAFNVGNMTTPKIHSASIDLFWDYAIHETIRSRTNRELSIKVVQDTGYNHYQNTDKPRNYYEKLKAAIENEGPRVRYLVYAAWEAFLHDEVDNGVNFAQQAADKILNNKNDEYYQNYSWLAMAYYYIGRGDISAEEKIQLFEEIQSYIDQGKMIDYRNLHYTLFNLYKDLGQIDKAEEQLLRCIKIRSSRIVDSWLDDYELYNDYRIYTELLLLCYYNNRAAQALGYAVLAQFECNCNNTKTNFDYCLNRFYEQYRGEN